DSQSCGLLSPPCDSIDASCSRFIGCEDRHWIAVKEPFALAGNRDAKTVVVDRCSKEIDDLRLGARVGERAREHVWHLVAQFIKAFTRLTERGVLEQRL